MANQDRDTITITRRVVQSGDVANNFNAVRFVNKGTSTATINGFPLAPGESYGWGHNVNEVDKGSYTISFDAATGNNVYVTYTFYKDNTY